MRPPWIDGQLLDRLYARAAAERWDVSRDLWASTLRGSADRAFVNGLPSPRALEQYLEGLHLEDLALACGCRAGHSAAWEHFVLEYRPVLYRAADALEPGGGGRDLADALVAELYGVPLKGEPVASLFRYYHGRSRLDTWLRAVLSQRFVDRVRARRRFEPLPEGDASEVLAATPSAAEPERPRWLAMLQRELTAAIARLEPADRLRLGLYYAQGLTLAEIGRLSREHEATVSRALARTRRAVRAEVEAGLRREGLGEAEIQACFASAIGDAGPLNLRELLAVGGERKESDPDRSS